MQIHAGRADDNGNGVLEFQEFTSLWEQLGSPSVEEISPENIPAGASHTRRARSEGLREAREKARGAPRPRMQPKPRLARRI